MQWKALLPHCAVRESWAERHDASTTHLDAINSILLQVPELPHELGDHGGGERNLHGVPVAALDRLGGAQQRARKIKTTCCGCWGVKSEDPRDLDRDALGWTLQESLQGLAEMLHLGGLRRGKRVLRVPGGLSNGALCRATRVDGLLASPSASGCCAVQSR